MHLPFVVIVTGPPGTGKTTLAEKIGEVFQLPVFNKDGIKEILFDTLGWSDREWSKRLGYATYMILYHVMERELAAGASFIVESNFHAAFDTERFRALHERHRFTAFQVNCVADGDVLYERFKERADSGERHPGHGDAMNLDEFEDILRRGRHDPLDIGGAVYEVDMTDYEKIDYDALYAAIRTVTGQE
jgi:predicted kinase